MNPQDFIHHLTEALDRGAGDLDAATCSRLAGMRHAAVHRGIRHAGHGTLAQIHRHPWLILAMTAGMLYAGWHFLQLQMAQDAADTDILLLTDELPPSAYVNQDFSKWLKSQGN